MNMKQKNKLIIGMALSVLLIMCSGYIASIIDDQAIRAVSIAFVTFFSVVFGNMSRYYDTKFPNSRIVIQISE
jgi:hypothetical protein